MCLNWHALYKQPEADCTADWTRANNIWRTPHMYIYIYCMCIHLYEINNEICTHASSSSKWIDSEDTILCQWAYGRGADKRPQTNSLKSSKSSPHEITWDSACAISGSPILSEKIKRKNKEGQLICPWGHQPLQQHCSWLQHHGELLDQSTHRQNATSFANQSQLAYHFSSVPLTKILTVPYDCGIRILTQISTRTKQVNCQPCKMYALYIVHFSFVNQTFYVRQNNWVFL